MLTIDRLRLECLTARDHPAPQEVSSRLRRIAQRELPNRLSAQLNQAIAPTDRRIVMIRRLRVQLHLDASLAEDVLAKAFASVIAAGIQAADTDDDVVVYADETEQTARLLVDLATGAAWRHWYHRRAFPGLAHLPPTAAIRTVALESPREFLDATPRLTMSSLQQLTAALDPIDADRIVAALSVSSHAAVADPETVETAVCALRDDHPVMRGDTLLLILATRRLVPSASIREILEAVRATQIETARRPVLAPSVDHEITWTTTFGALFLLLPYLVEAGPVVADTGQRRGVAVALAGPGVQDDSAVRALLGLDETPSAASQNAPVDTLEWLIGVNAIGPVQPVVRYARFEGRRISVVIDAPTGHWLAVASGVGTAAAIRRVTDRFACVDARPPIRLARELRRLGALQHTTLDDCLTATNLVRRMANSLPGFATASSAHVWREALDIGADVTVTPTGWLVRLQRSPLAEILRICGHGDRTTMVPWLDGMHVRVVIEP